MIGVASSSEPGTASRGSSVPPIWSFATSRSSSPTGAGIPDVWERVTAAHRHLAETGQLPRLRAGQARAWMWDEVRSGLMERFRADTDAAADLHEREVAVSRGEQSPTAAAQAILDHFLHLDPDRA